MATNKLRIVPLGGLGEIGKNMMALEYGGDMIVIDAGLMFPSEEMLGVDLLIPDIGYLLERQQSLRGIVITHGHEDHIGALPHILPRLSAPIYSTKFTRELISAKLKQRGGKSQAKLNTVSPGNRINLGCLGIEFFSVCHSIPDSVGVIIHTPEGTVVHSGDFKLDHTPIIHEATNFNQLALLGTRGVLLLLSDSTYVELPGYNSSESVVTDTLDRIVADAKGRVVITTFASLVSRIQQVIDVAIKRGRRVFVTGRSMRDIVNMSLKFGYLSAPNGVLCRLEELKHLPYDQVILLTTGSQGEPTSALVRMANRDPRSPVQIVPGDTVVISATPIPGNEGLVNRTTDSLFRQGADVIYGKRAQVHVHGHGSSEELKLLLSLVKPKFFVPVHGEYRHLCLHAKLAQEMGMPKENTFVLENGDILELGQDSGSVVGKARVGDVYVNGLLTGELGSAVLRDRRLLSRDGVVVVTVAIDATKGRVAGRPVVTMRGFVDTDDNQALIEKSQDVVLAALNSDRGCLSDRACADARIRNTLSRFFYERTHRRPVVIPVLVEGGKVLPPVPEIPEEE